MRRRYKNRIDLINALVIGSDVASNPVQCNTVITEFDLVNRCFNIPALPRRHVLMVLHSTRALDTTLRCFLDYHGIRGRNNAMGKYLHALTTHRNPRLGHLTPAEKSNFQNLIVSKRNTYMHEAGAFPNNNAEIFQLLGDMHACLSRVLGL